VSSGFFNDLHSERGFPCPHNHFGISDYNRLLPIEDPLVASRGVELENAGITGKFDSAHLRAIHRHLFQDVFPWAGEFRVVNAIHPFREGNGRAQRVTYLDLGLRPRLVCAGPTALL
jgi:fido (protein-threonine AMPylation protein)